MAEGRYFHTVDSWERGIDYCVQELGRRIAEVAQATGCDKNSVERLARALFSAKLMSEYLEILTPPQLSYEKTARGTVDLLESLFDSFREIVGGAWSVTVSNPAPAFYRAKATSVCP